MAGERAELVAFLDSLDDEQLRTYRFELYDRLELVAEASETYRFARGALDVVYGVEREREFRRGLRIACRVEAPDADADAFVDAVIELARIQRALGSNDAAGVFAGALEVARRRAEGKQDVSAGPSSTNRK